MSPTVRGGGPVSSPAVGDVSPGRAAGPPVPARGAVNQPSAEHLLLPPNGVLIQLRSLQPSGYSPCFVSKFAETVEIRFGFKPLEFFGQLHLLHGQLTKLLNELIAAHRHHGKQLVGSSGETLLL